jgi:hypothetical protein
MSNQRIELCPGVWVGVTEKPVVANPDPPSLVKEEEPPLEATPVSDTTLHFVRIRSKNEESFYDQQADIRCILPEAAKTVCDDLLTIHAGDPKWTHDLAYLKNCIEVFRIRVCEDPTQLIDQVPAFLRAIEKVDPLVFAQFSSGLFLMESMIYALFMRRDVKVDGEGEYRMLTTGSLVDLLRFIPENIRIPVIDTLRDHKGVRETVISVSQASCADLIGPTGFIERLEHLKERAGRFINATGDTSWEGLASACDEMFMSASDANVLDKAALALAYPVYEHSTQCEMTPDDIARKD